MFEAIRNLADDPIEAVFARSAADARRERLDLSIGVYRDAAGAASVLDAVSQAEARLLAGPRPKGYLSPLGNRRYVELTEALVFGADSAVRREGRLVSAQGPGAGGMLRVGAELAKSIDPDITVWVPDPIWEHQLDFFSSAGLRLKPYPYYDRARHALRFGALLEAIAGCRRGDLLLLHGCCHNPTGADPDLDQWRALADALAACGVVPFVDVAYQGFGDGLERDVAGLRLLAERVPELLLAVSSSKSFTIYRERVGMLSLLLPPGADRTSVTRRLRDLIRSNYFMPPDHGASVVAEVLDDPELRAAWAAGLERFRQRILASRDRLAAALEEQLPGSNWGFLRRQKGMFSVLPLSAAQLERLIVEFAVYLLPSGRLNFAALPDEHTRRCAQALAAVLGG